MRGEPDYALHEASRLFGEAGLLLIPNPAEGQLGLAAGVIVNSPRRLRSIGGQP